MSSASYVYTGPWVNHSHGVVLGATITLTTRDGAFLLALLAIIVTTAGHSFWRIISYITHQVRSNAGQHDSVFYQEQAILKNSGTALDAAWRFSRASFAWRKHTKSKSSRSLLFIAMGLILAAAFAVAGIFSSQVTKAASGEFLISSDNCGFANFSPNSSADNFYKLDQRILNETNAAANYASHCYGTSIADAAQCDTYMIPDITWTANQNASCPFASGTCLLSPTAAYQMDTGPLDSHYDLGLNAKSSERVAVRKVATCAPAHIEPYAVFVNVTFPDGDVDLIAELYLGNLGLGSITNVTYFYDLHAEYIIGLGYELGTITTYGPSSNTAATSVWSPIAAFNRTDADVSMFFLAANSIIYTYPNSDPIFSANVASDSGEEINNVEVLEYSAEYAVAAMACTDQYQICNPTLAGLDGEPMLCTPLGPIFTLFEESEPLGMNLYQLSTVETIVIAMQSSSMYNSVAGRGSAALKAQSTVFTLGDSNLQMAPLPNNQWQIELSGWFAVSLASLQQFLFEKASGPPNVQEADGYIIKPNNKYEKAICQRQMIRNVAGYQNFSTLGVAIILILGCGLVVVGLVIDTVVGRIQRHKKVKQNYQRLSWISDGYLQLQRLAYEGAGYDGWDGCADEVPVSKDIQQNVPELGGLDISDIDHPQLVQCTTTPASSDPKSSTEQQVVRVSSQESQQTP